MKNLKEKIIIDSGSINLDIYYLDKEYKSIQDLLSFASRKNAKRGFLFVSRILGKHIPVKPSIMRKSYNKLASKIGKSKEKTFVVGMSETATGLGGGIADSLSKMDNSKEVFFQHTTRHQLDSEVWFNLVESHSHAVAHTVYKPNEQLVDSIVEAKRLVLVDDEISTGKTLIQLAKGYLSKMKEVDEIEIVSLVSWLSPEKEDWFSDQIDDFCREKGYLLPKVTFHAFAKGDFVFHPDPYFHGELPKLVDKELATEQSLSSYGRTGIKLPFSIDEELKAQSQKETLDHKSECVIVGTGEHLYLPFLYAEALEKSGMSVLFQSTTRSPVLQDDKVITSTITFDVKRKNAPLVNHFIYNLPKNKHIVLLAESEKAEKWYSKITETNNTKQIKGIL